MGPKAQGITKTGIRAHICFFLLLRRFLGLWLLATVPRIQFLRLPPLKLGIGPFGCPEAIEKKGIFLAQNPEPVATTLQILHALSYYQLPPTFSPVANATTHLPLISVVSADEKRNLN